MTLPVLETHLKEISSQLIRARRHNDGSLLGRYLNQAGGDPRGLSLNRLFMKTVQLYHPDLLKVYWDEGLEIRDKGGPAAYEKWMSRYQPIPEPKDSEVLTGELFYKEDYGEDERNLFTDGWGPEEDPEDSDCLQGISFLTALKKNQFGNLEIYPSLSDLEDLDGDLDLGGWDIVDLEGVEHCLGLEGLHLGTNKISNPTPLGALVQLKSLDLSDNLVKTASALESLGNLRELDLSMNQVVDVSFLLKLPRLTFVNLMDNPVGDVSLLNRLKDRGVAVLF